MRRQTPIANLLYHHLFPNAGSTDPPTFSAHLARNLVPEVRVEVSHFYGDLNSNEARYPGLNYAYGPHRLRLGHFKHHRRLFEAFDALGLTYGEIQDFCCWEGTKWARERYEKDEGITVPDTTGDEIGPYVDRRKMKAVDEQRRHSITRKTSISVVVEQAMDSAERQVIAEEHDEFMSDADSEAEDEDGEDADEHDDQTVGTLREATPAEHATRQQLMAQLDSRRVHTIHHRHLARAIQQGLPLSSEEIEQYIKEQSEHNDLSTSELRARLASAVNSAAALTSATTNSVPVGNRATA